MLGRCKTKALARLGRWLLRARLDAYVGVPDKYKAGKNGGELAACKDTSKPWEAG